MKIIKITYKCDSCHKKLPDPHLSLTFGDGYSGSVTEVLDGKWRHSIPFVKSKAIMQFCSGKCLERYFQFIPKK